MLENKTTITYGGVNSADLGLCFDQRSRVILPTQRKYSQEIPGLDGEVDFKIGGYKTKVFPLPVYYKGRWEDFDELEDKIISWLYSPNGEAKQLIFNRNPNKYYMAKVNSALNFKVGERFIGTIQFECNPPWAYENNVLLTPELIKWNNQDSLDGTQWLKTFTESGRFRLTNTETREVKPVIKLYGNIPQFTQLNYGSQSFQYNDSVKCDGIVIDCENETVTRVSDGANLYNHISPVFSDYFIFKPGKIEIGVERVNELGEFPNNLTMIVDLTRYTCGGIDNNKKCKYESGGNG